jgi:hypothetical protein
MPGSAFAWTESIDEVSPAALTVLAQAVSPNDNGRLKWDMFFPRKMSTRSTSPT